MATCHPNFTIAIPLEIATSYLYNKFHETLILGVIPLLMLIGITGNLSFLFVILKVQYMRTITNFYLANLAVADLTFIMVMPSGLLWSYAANSQVNFAVPFRSSAGCILYNFFAYFTFFASTSLITLMTMERYVAICKPLFQRMVSGRSRSVKFVIGAWAVAIIFTGFVTPSVTVLKYKCMKWPKDQVYENLPSKVYVCAKIGKWTYWFLVYAQAIPFWFALVVNTIMSYKIIKELSRRKYLSSSSIKAITTTTRNQVAKMLIANNVAFFLCLGPLQIVNICNMIYLHTGYAIFNEYVLDICIWLGRMAAAANSAINPIIYNITNPRYRVAFSEMFGRGPASVNQQRTASISDRANSIQLTEQ